jgi:hypothetical protein
MEGTMSKEITLPSGHTVKLRDPATLLMKDRNKVMEFAGKAENDVEQAIAISNGLVAVMVVEWSFDLIPPSIRPASLGELTPRDYDFLAAEVDEAANYLFPNLTAEGKDDPKASTANSND